MIPQPKNSYLKIVDKGYLEVEEKVVYTIETFQFLSWSSACFFVKLRAKREK